MKENFVIRVYGVDKTPEIPIQADYPVEQNCQPCKVLLLTPFKSAKITGFQFFLL